MGNYEWDIKNNFIYHSDGAFAPRYSQLPALIPNRYIGDQWSKRDLRMHQSKNGTRFLFTYLRGAKLINGERGREFLDVILSEEQIATLNRLFDFYRGASAPNAPYSEDKFWKDFRKGDTQSYAMLHDRPRLIFCAYGEHTCWGTFFGTGAYV